MSIIRTTPAGFTATHCGIVYTVTQLATGWQVQSRKINSQVRGAIRRYTDVHAMAKSVTALRGLPDHLALHIYH